MLIVYKLREPQPPGALRACPDLLWDSFTFTFTFNFLLLTRKYRVFQKELYNYLDFKCGSARGGGIGYYSTTYMKGIVYLDMLQEFLIPSLWLRYGPLDLGVGVTVEVP
jgi:hypothetical protein